MRITLVVLCFLILGAHFMRDGNTLFMLLSLAAPLLLFIKRRWALLAIQTFLGCGAVLWVFIAVELTQARMSQGEPWLRMALILAAVAVVTAYSACMLNSGKLRNKYSAT